MHYCVLHFGKIVVKSKKSTYKFIDLFAGIGGFHLAFHKTGAECVFASEKDLHARSTYFENFKKVSPSIFKKDLFDSPLFNDDITKVIAADVPNH